MGVGGQQHAPAALPLGKTRYPLYSRLGGPQRRSGWVRKISPPPGFDPRIVQPAASRYTDYAIRTARYVKVLLQIILLGFTTRHRKMFQMKGVVLIYLQIYICI